MIVVNVSADVRDIGTVWKVKEQLITVMRGSDSGWSTIRDIDIEENVGTSIN